VGASGDDGGRGAAYVFVPDLEEEDTWTEQDKLTDPEPAADEYLGISVALQGNQAIAGAPFDTVNEVRRGSASVFTLAGESWSFDEKLYSAGATTTIEFALYGVGGSQGVIDALVAADARGVTVRGVMDTGASGWYPYRDSETLINALPVGSVVVDDDDDIMHNKFFVIDDRWVWTGSGNVSDTGLYVEYNANWSILIDHVALAGARFDWMLKRLREAASGEPPGGR